MGKDFIIHVSKAKLKGANNKVNQFSSISSILNSLIKEKLLNSYAECYQLTFDKDKAIHIQSVLEFYGIKGEVISSPKNIRKENE